MDAKHHRLITYLTQLKDPVPPPTPAAPSPFETTVVPAPVHPPALTPGSVQHMLEAQRTAQVADEHPQPPRGGFPLGSDGITPPITEHIIELAVRGMEKIANEEEPSAEELGTLEAIVVPGKRPVLDISQGAFSAPPPDWAFLEDYRPQLEGLLPAIGRIDVPELIFPPYVGTGFFVGADLLMTNRHVANRFVEGVGAGRRYLRFLAGRSPALSARYEVGDPDETPPELLFHIVEPLLIHPHWDVALLRVAPAGASPLPTPLTLAGTQPSQFGGGSTPHIVVVGYPMLDQRSNIGEQQQIFRGIFGRKRLMPGFLRTFSDQPTRWHTTQHAVTHDASTLGGNSGSAVIDLLSGQVLAVHFGGRYLEANYGVPCWELARDERVVACGLHVAASAPTADPGPPASTINIAQPTWLNAWTGVTPLHHAEQPAPDPAGAPGAENPLRDADVPQQLPLAPDWYELTSTAELLAAMRRDAAQTEGLLRTVLYPAEADDLIADLHRVLGRENAPDGSRIALEGLFERGGVDPALPEIVFLHGFAGSHLSAHGRPGERVWLAPLAFTSGGVGRRLAVAPEGDRDLMPNQLLYPDGHVRLIYEKAARKWRMAGFVVHEFTYDWRKPAANAADRLHHLVELLRLERPAKKLALVGHSMGGVVAALYAARHPEWSRTIVQALFLGSPLRGCYAPLEVLLGLERHGSFDAYHTALRTMPGLLDLLPDPELFPDAAVLYERAAWPAALAPAQSWLDQSRQVKRLVAQSPILQGAHLIVSPGHPTIQMVRLEGGQLRAGPRTGTGDGTVPVRSAAASLDGVRVYKARQTHGSLPREAAVISAVAQLLSEGRCDLPMLTRRDIDDLGSLAEAPDRHAATLEAAPWPPPHHAERLTQQDADYYVQLGWGGVTLAERHGA